MPQIHRLRSKPAIAVAALVLTALLLSACGGSSAKSSSSTNASATTSTTGGSRPTGSGFAAVRECLQKNGITLPQRPSGQKPGEGRGPGSGGFLGGAGGPQLPKGVTRAQYEAAVKKCGGSPRGGSGARGAGRFSSPAAKQALAKFATCMRENGVNVPAPNTSGKGPVFNTKGLNTASTQFKTAQSKCASALRGAFRAQPGTAGAPPASAG